MMTMMIDNRNTNICYVRLVTQRLRLLLALQKELKILLKLQIISKFFSLYANVLATEKKFEIERNESI